MTRDELAAAYAFGLDAFQVRALDALDAGRSVVVAAPTGSGKTLVAEYALAKALSEGGKAFYTTPLKALSNQKFGDLVAQHGAERVGLLTGDISRNGEAPVVVMTTEVLRNMLYAASPTLRGLRYVVLDEVHYLQDRERGPVWEEVIIHTPPDVDLVCLSATVSNAEELADWVGTVRGATDAVIEERRPVELTHWYAVADRAGEDVRLLPTFVEGRPNPEAAGLDAAAARPGAVGGGRGGLRAAGRHRTPRREEIVEELGGRAMLPAITFIFSRAGCDDAVRQCLRAGLRLTTGAEREAIRAVAEAKVEVLSDADLAALGYGEWMTGLEAGLAAHHAGLVPAFKEAVEVCFAAGLVKAVFATETLSLGINMPARSVVIEKLSKFGGERHEMLTPGEYTQLTGRAGRRGIDDVGHAVVVWSPFVPFDQVAGLASTRSYALTSSFRPTYNMAVNLVRQYPPDEAHHLLNLSFAQYHADRDVVRLEAQIERTTSLLAKAAADATCELGDVEEYRASAVGDVDLPIGGRPDRRAAVAAALERLRPGDVITLGGGKSAGRVVVVTTGHRRGADVRIGALRPDRRWLNLTARDFAFPPRKRAAVDVPVPYAPRATSFQRELARRLGALDGVGRVAEDDAVLADEGSDADRDRASRRTAADATVADCPDLRRHLAATARADRLRKDLRRLNRRVEGRSDSLARQLDRVLEVLTAWGYVDGWSLTEAGSALASTYTECDLLVVEALRRGLFDGHDPTAVAALASAFTFESRRGPKGAGPPPEPWFPSSRVRRCWTELEALAGSLNAAEEQAGLPRTRSPDPGFFAAAYGWAAGEDLGEIIAEEELTGGDFVRNVKRLVDLLGGMAAVAERPDTAQALAGAAERLQRGVVAASSVLVGPEPPVDPEPPDTSQVPVQDPSVGG